MSDKRAISAYPSHVWLLLAITVAIVAAAGVSVAGQTTHGFPTRHLLANGLDVTLHRAEDLAARLTALDGDAVIPLDGSRYLRVITDINDPSISNRGDGEFHPFEADAVLDALGQISHPNVRMPVDIYILPYPRRSVLVSSTTGAEIFLSPHVLDIPSAVSAYIVTHELGHAFHNRYMPDGSRGWQEYRQVRGIEDEYVYAEAATHANRPKEIFAEDFRALFGGSEAVWDGRIENADLVAPRLVMGLESFMREIGGERTYGREVVAATSVPNPFNPDTEIRVSVPEDVLAGGGEVSVRVYDVRGALVKTVYTGVPTDVALNVRWDGTDNNGNPVASAQYFAQIRAGSHKTTLKLVMLK